VNLLKLHDVFEEDDKLYLMYENFDSITLGEVFYQHAWTQEQIANLVRELLAGVAYAQGMNLPMLAWTLSHVLLHRSCLSEDPRGAKIFGMGMVGTLAMGFSDISCWAPEAVDLFRRSGEGFILRMEGPQRMMCDLWSLGVVIFCVVAHKRPFSGDETELPKNITTNQWAFGISFDEMDMEAKALLESMLVIDPDKRLKAKFALLNPWIRRRWIHPPIGPAAFKSLYSYCTANLTKQLFGKFLIKFLNSEQLLLIYDAFCALDAQGDGLLCRRDVRSACVLYADAPVSAFDKIWACMCPEPLTSMSLSRFSECMAEQVLDGPNLRHAFESLDDDGSECISPEELWAELCGIDSSLTLDEVMVYMEEAEVQIGGEGEAAKDSKLEFAEFVRLFPERMRHLQSLQDRFDSSLAHAYDVSGNLEKVHSKVKAWIQTLDDNYVALDDQGGELLSAKKAGEPIKAIQELFSIIQEMLGNPPGIPNHQILGGKKVRLKKGETPGFGYDTFLQDKALMEHWPNLIDPECHRLRSALARKKGNANKVDRFSVNDSVLNVLNKIKHVVTWSKEQVEEYESLSDALRALEAPMAPTSLSGRGLALVAGEQDEEQANDDALLDEGTQKSGCCIA